MAEVKKAAPEQEEGAEGEGKIGVSGSQVAGGALASVTAAFLGGQLGVAGTLWGAGLTSVVITVGGAVYQRSLETSQEKAGMAAAKAGLRKRSRSQRSAESSATGEDTARRDSTAAPPGQPSANPVNPAAGRAPDSDPARTHRMRPAADSGMRWPGGERVLDQSGRPLEDEARMIGRAEPLDRTHLARAGAAARSRKRIRWGMVAVTSAMIFGLGMLLLTGFEGIVGKPVSGGQAGTTVGRLVPHPAEPLGPPAVPATSPSEQPDQPDRLRSGEPSSEPEYEQDRGTDPAPREQEPVPRPAETAPPASGGPVPTYQAPAEEGVPESGISPQNGITGEKSEDGEQ